MSAEDLAKLAEALSDDIGDTDASESESSETADLQALLGGDDDSGDGDSDDGGSGGGDGGSGSKPSFSDEEKRDRNLAMILDVPLRLTAELGRTRMLISDLLNLGQGSVVELTKLAGEPMEIFVNDKLIAKGEAVVVNEKFGVRLTDIVSLQERVEGLK